MLLLVKIVSKAYINTHRYFTACLLILGVLLSHTVVAAPVMMLPLCFHIIDGLPMQKKGVEMVSWVSPENITQTLLPEANRIWLPAGIQFQISCINKINVVDHPRKLELLQQVEQASRDEDGKSDKQRIHALDALIDKKSHNPSAINIYLVPYLGEASQGNTSRKQRRIYLGQWTDKASKASMPPLKFSLIEVGEYRQGSLGRTLAHEIGHVLGLQHPDKTSQVEFDLLMGGRKEGYTLTTQEIQTARQFASSFH